MYKLSHLVEADWTEHSHAPHFQVEPVGEIERLVVGAPSGQPEPFEQLVLSLEPPYFLLYILHTPRGGGEAGRYQSSPLSAEEFRSFMASYGNYLSSDARFDIWAHSPAESATVVWNRHNQIFAYGPLERLETSLRALGFSEGSCHVPVPHRHHYRSEFDSKAAELLSHLEWQYSELREEDEQ